MFIVGHAIQYKGRCVTVATGYVDSIDCRDTLDPFSNILRVSIEWDRYLTSIPRLQYHFIQIVWYHSY